ncbi:hypothetical protein AX17_002810 [Amanita inopinata Kibby_2008]|nr:hypothetical protein AX17_002810 [Amanita inopinata Kibby_2008]
MEDREVYEAIIVGGGCSTALALHRVNPSASFVILDDANATTFKINFWESLPASATQYLRYLSPTFFDRLSQDTSHGKHIRCTGNISAWVSHDLDEQHAILNPFGKGWHLDRAFFDQSLRESVIDICQGSERDTMSQKRVIKARFLSIRKDGDLWDVLAEELLSQRECHFQAKWVVDASGRKACLAQKLGAKTVKSDSLLAFYAVLLSTGPKVSEQLLEGH